MKARTWAVAVVSDTAMKGRITKARRFFKVGSRGLLYCRPTESFTTPFIAESAADSERVVTDIWPEPWCLPFSIRPLGDPSKRVHKNSARLRWPILHRQIDYPNITAAMNATGTTVFVPIDITDEDWSIILEDLAT